MSWFSINGLTAMFIVFVLAVLIAALFLGVLTLIDMLFQTELVKRVDGWLFYYEDENIESI